MIIGCSVCNGSGFILGTGWRGTIPCGCRQISENTEPEIETQETFGSTQPQYKLSATTVKNLVVFLEDNHEVRIAVSKNTLTEDMILVLRSGITEKVFVCHFKKDDNG